MLHFADIYISMVSATNLVASKGWYIAMVSTTVETANPEAEILPGLQLLGPITEKCVDIIVSAFVTVEACRFVTVSDEFAPADMGAESQVFISEYYDATSHFETTCHDVLAIWRRAQGKEFDFSQIKHLSLDGADE